MKKAQLFSQPFMIIFTLIVIALILFFGYKVILGLTNTGEKVCKVKFTQDFQNEVDDLYTQPIGSNTRINIPTCASMKAVCVLTVNPSAQVPYKDIQQVLNALSQTPTSNNVFFSSTEQKTSFEPLSIKKLQPSKTVCDDTLDGKFTLLLENKGRYVDATETH